MVSNWIRPTPRVLGFLMVVGFFFLLRMQYSVVDAYKKLTNPDRIEAKLERVYEEMNKYPRDDDDQGRSNDPQKNVTFTKFQTDFKAFDRALNVCRRTNSTEDCDLAYKLVVKLLESIQALNGDGGHGGILEWSILMIGAVALLVALALVCNNCANKKRKSGGSHASAQTQLLDQARKTMRSNSVKKAGRKRGRKKAGSSTGGSGSSSGGKTASAVTESSRTASKGSSSSGPTLSFSTLSRVKSSTGAVKPGSSSVTKPASSTSAKANLSSAVSTGSGTSGSATSSTASSASDATSATSTGSSFTGPAISVTAPSRTSATSAAKSSIDPKPSSKTEP